MSTSIEPVPTTLIFQSAKLGDIRPHLLDEIRRARSLLDEVPAIGRIFGVSGGVLVALAAGVELAARRYPARWGRGGRALEDLASFLASARSRDLRRPAWPPWYGFYRLDPLRDWLAARLRDYAGRQDVRLSDLGVPLYLGSMDEEGILTLQGPADESLQCPYHAVRVGPPRDAPIVEAAIAGVSTLLSTVPALVRTGDSREVWLRDARPAIVDAGAIVADLEAAEPRPIVRTVPHAPVRRWPLNWFTSSFIMHSQNERNQTLLAGLYLDLLDRQRRLQRQVREARAATARTPVPAVYHVDLPYIGSTEAFTNMRQSTENKDALMARFEQLLDGQLDDVRFDQPVNIIYGAGGFSGILGGLVTTRHVETAIRRAGGEVRQVYGVSAGVLNGFFHAVQIAARVHPSLYRPAAADALEDLEGFVAGVSPKKIGRINLNPVRLWRGWANLGPLEEFLLDRLAAYTGTNDPACVTFDDVRLPLTVACARGDGFTDFLGPSEPVRAFTLGGQTWRPINGPIVRSMIAGWSMNTYVEPARLHGQAYRDGGGTFYDPGAWIACMDARLSSLLNIHLDEPEGHSYHLPARPDLLRILFDTHNYIFPEERRRMRLLTDLLYEHYALRREAAAAGLTIEDDFRQTWTVAG
jgi:hypothetical protein